MSRILFTKEIEPNWLREQLIPKLEFSIQPFLEIVLNKKEIILNQIDTEIENNLISSQNSVKAIEELEVNGQFLVVGCNTTKLLIQNGYIVKHTADYAQELVEYILNNYEPTNWNFYCGNSRRDTLLERLREAGHTVNEIFCYTSTQSHHTINWKEMDGYVFFSPLAVKSYFERNSISQTSQIFSIGKTTTEELQKYTTQNIIVPDFPDLGQMIKKINEYYGTEK